MIAAIVETMRKLVSSGSPYEAKVGFSRAVRAGSVVSVAGSAPLGQDGRTVGRGDVAAQARRCLEIIVAALDRYDVYVQAATSFGKSLCFQLPAVIDNGSMSPIPPSSTLWRYRGHPLTGSHLPSQSPSSFPPSSAS